MEEMRILGCKACGIANERAWGLGSFLTSNQTYQFWKS